MEYLPFQVLCNTREDCVEFEDFLHKRGWSWDGGVNYLIRNGTFTRITFGHFKLAKKIFSGWNSFHRDDTLDFFYIQKINEIF